MKKRTKILFSVLFFLTLSACICITTFAEDGQLTEDAGFFEEIFTVIRIHSSEILSALAFAGSMILSFAYKRGMMPTLKKGISSIGTTVSDIKDVSKEVEKIQNELAEEVRTRLEQAESALTEIEKALKDLSTDKAEHEKTNAVIGEQVSLLYDVFMFSSIPEYQKDAVGHRVEKMRSIIAGAQKE